MKKTKLEKGITLVALIITIVVLLILAVVSIGAVRDSEIIGHATNTSDTWKLAQEKENSVLQGHEDFLKENNPNISPYDDFFQAVRELLNTLKDENGEANVAISDRLMVGIIDDESMGIIYSLETGLPKRILDGEPKL